MNIKIKVCGITNIDDLKNIEKLGVDHIGFINIKRSKRYVSIEKIKEMQKKLYNKNLSTLVLEPNNAYETIQKINQSEIFNLQLHSLKAYDVKYIQWLNQYHNPKKVNITKTIGLNDTINNFKRKEIEAYCLNCNHILLDYIKDGKTGGTNTQIPIETAIEASKIIKNKCKNTKITLAGGLNKKYLQKIYDELDYFDMIDLNSGVEIKPGIKDVKKIKKIVELISD